MLLSILYLNPLNDCDFSFEYLAIAACALPIQNTDLFVLKMIDRTIACLTYDCSHFHTPFLNGLALFKLLKALNTL